MDAHIELSFFTLALVALLFHLLTNRSHKLVDSVACFAAVVACFAAVVARFAVVLARFAAVVARFAAVVAPFALQRVTFFPCRICRSLLVSFVFVLEARICSARGIFPATGSSFIGAFSSRAFTIWSRTRVLQFLKA